MKMQSLHISNGYGGQDHYTGTVTFAGSSGDIKLNLNERLSQKVLDVVSDAMVEAASEAAETMKASVIESIAGNRLEDKSGEVIDGTAE